MDWIFAFMRRSLRSPARHPRIAVVLGRLLGVAFLICFLTGLYSHFIQNPIPGMFFPSRPVNLYRITQGLHVITGIACIPLLLGKLFTVYPLLFRWPPLTRSLLDFIERASITVFVASSLLQLFTGLWNTYHWYVWPFPFRQVHYALAWVIIGSLAIHIAFKLPIIRRWWTRAASYDRATGDLLPVLPGEGDLTGGATVYARGLTGWFQRKIDAPQPAAGVSRRTVLVTVGAAAGIATVMTAGETVPALSGTNLLAPRSQGYGPQRLSVNKTARQANVIAKAMDANWSLTVKFGDRKRSFTLAELRRMPQTTVKLPIACVEGWSEQAIWTGVRLIDLARMVGAERRDFAIQSLQRGAYARTMLENNFVRDPLTLIALKVNGETLHIDHGYPARLIAPGRPGVLQTKWLDYVEAQ